MSAAELLTKVTNDTAQTTGTEVSSSEPMISKEEVKSFSDEKLKEMHKKAQGHTTDFKEYLNCDFSYSFFSNVLKQRGLPHRLRNANNEVSRTDTPDIITLNKSEYSTIRKSYTVSSKTAEEWKKFSKDIPNPSVLLSAAMERLMNDYKAGKVKFEFKADI